MVPFSFLTPTASADGYGVAGEMLARAAVEHHSADIAVVPYDWRDDRYSAPEFLQMLVHESEIPKREVLVAFFLPYALARFQSYTNLSMTMWESDRLPETWARLLEGLADGVIVPSEHCAEVFRDSISKPVVAVPFGTDADFYGVVDREPSETFTFLMSGRLHYRKGVDFALRALREEFEPGEPVRLVLKTRLDSLDAVDEWQTLGDERVLIIDADYTREQMRDLYGQADAFLAPSRGEGSGLTPRDAMATGLPTIVTDWGGLAELADERYTYPVEVEDLEVAPQENSSYGLGVTGGGPIGNFARPSITSLRAQMRRVYEDRNAARVRGLAAAEWVRRCWTWERCARLWLQAIEELSAKVAA